MLRVAGSMVTFRSTQVKIIEKKNVAQEYKKNLQTETEILRSVSHASIIRLEEMFETDDFLFLVMELVVGGELFDRIVEKGAYSEREASDLVRRIVAAISYLHEAGICHRDL
jgi:calcium/calmodulin-dependent protein kinase I